MTVPSFLKAPVTHFLIVAALLFGAVYTTADIYDRHEEKLQKKTDVALAVATSQAQAAAAALQKVQEQVAIQNAVLKSQNAALSVQVGSLAAQIKARNAASAAQQQADATLTAQEAASRLAVQLHSGPSDIVAGPDTVTLSLPAARDAAEELDVLVETLDDLTDTRDQLAAETAQVTNLTQIDANDQTVIAGQTTDIAALNKELSTTRAADAQTIKTLKTKNFRSKLRWFGAGYIAGFVTAAVAHI